MQDISALVLYHSVLILGVIDCIREGEKKEALVKVGWLAVGWGNSSSWTCSHKR